jgi:hypothetical protein
MLRSLQYCENTTGNRRVGESRNIAAEEQMPRKQHLRGVSAKEQREYEHIKERAVRSGRHGERAKDWLRGLC